MSWQEGGVRWQDEDVVIDYRVLKRSYPVAAKSHTCWQCKRTIKTGEKYTYIVLLADGEFWYAKYCLGRLGCYHP